MTGPMPMPTMHMSMPLLPLWLQILWSAALLAVVVLHIWHAWHRPGQHRLWHGGHTIMAAGMIWMYLAMPTMGHPSQARAALVLFAVLTAALVVIALVWWRREHVLNPLWIASAADMLAMTYMLIPAMARPAALTWIVVAYLGLQALAWAIGAWARLPLYRPSPGEPGVSQPAPTTPVSEPPHAPHATVTAPAIQAATAARTGLSGRITLDVRITLAIMAASMAYMLAAT